MLVGIPPLGIIKIVQALFTVAPFDDKRTKRLLLGGR
jgi:hypothetical protein